MKRVVDASVALRWYVDAPGTGAALRALDDGQPLLAPDLVVAEVVNAARKLARAGTITAVHGRRIAEAIPLAFDHLVPAAQLVVRAFDLAAALDHPVHDCLYLALALRDDAVLLTADQRLLQRLRGTELAGWVRPLA